MNWVLALLLGTYLKVVPNLSGLQIPHQYKKIGYRMSLKVLLRKKKEGSRVEMGLGGGRVEVSMINNISNILD